MYKLQENEEGNEADQTAMDDGAAEAGNADDVATNYAETEVLLCETSRAVSSTSDVRPRENLSATAGSDGATAAETTPDAQFGTRKRFGTGFSQYCKRFWSSSFITPYRQHKITRTIHVLYTQGTQYTT